VDERVISPASTLLLLLLLLVVISDESAAVTQSTESSVTSSMPSLARIHSPTRPPLSGNFYLRRSHVRETF